MKAADKGAEDAEISELSPPGRDSEYQHSSRGTFVLSLSLALCSLVGFAVGDMLGRC